MRRHMFLMAVGALTLTACQPRSLTRQEMAVQEQALEARVAAWAKAFSNRQRDSLAAFYEQSEQFTFAWFDGERTSSWDEELAKQMSFFGRANQLNLVVQDARVELLATRAAFVTFRHAMDVIVGDVNPERRYFTGQGTMVWVRDGEKSPWLIRAGQISETPQPPPPPPAPTRRR
jgi:hypothetical protein